MLAYLKCPFIQSVPKEWPKRDGWRVSPRLVFTMVDRCAWDLLNFGSGCWDPEEFAYIVIARSSEFQGFIGDSLTLTYLEFLVSGWAFVIYPACYFYHIICEERRLFAGWGTYVTHNHCHLFRWNFLEPGIITTCPRHDELWNSRYLLNHNMWSDRNF